MSVAMRFPFPAAKMRTFVYATHSVFWPMIDQEPSEDKGLCLDVFVPTRVR